MEELYCGGWHNWPTSFSPPDSWQTGPLDSWQIFLFTCLTSNKRIPSPPKKVLKISKWFSLALRVPNLSVTVVKNTPGRNFCQFNLMFLGKLPFFIYSSSFCSVCFSHFPRPLEKKYDKACDFCKKHKTRINYVIYGILITGTVYYT